MAEDPIYQTCLRQTVFHDHECRPDPLTGKLIDWEHALYYAGSQLQERWAIVPLCWWAHRGPGLNKKINEVIALNRATGAELKKYERAGFFAQRSRLNKSFGMVDTS